MPRPRTNSLFCLDALPLRLTAALSAASGSPSRSRRRIASRFWCSVNFGLRPSLTPRGLARSRPSLVRVRIKSLSNSASPPKNLLQQIELVRRGLVDAPGGDLLDEELGESPHQ